MDCTYLFLTLDKDHVAEKLRNVVQCLRFIHYMHLPQKDLSNLTTIRTFQYIHYKENLQKIPF
jgi:hypothetical protein